MRGALIKNAGPTCCNLGHEGGSLVLGNIICFCGGGTFGASKTYLGVRSYWLGIELK